MNPSEPHFSGIRCLLAALLCLVSCVAGAQFYTSGSDAPGLKWMHFDTGHYEIIYPAGMDSLARSYAVSLERYSGFDNPGLLAKKKIPVILRNRTTYSNGIVVLPPLRAELYTTPDPYDALPTPWQEHLAAHETRHVGQMLATRQAPWNIIRILAGGLVDGAVVAVRADQSMYEGDAVDAETRLTRSGRGRTADFLEYYRVSFAGGDMRDFYRWRYGSQRHYTPDYYRAGYVAMAGGGAHFTGLPGMRFTERFDAACDSLAAFWRRDETDRAPFLEARQLIPEPSYYTEYTGLAVLGGTIYAVEKGLTRAASIVAVSPDGTVRRIGPMNSTSSRLNPSPSDGRLYWSEYVPDTRWEYLSHSDIFFLGPDGKRRRLTRGGRYFNPAPSPDGSTVAAAEYATDGRCAVCLLDSGSGEVLRRLPSPDGVQPVECVWIGEELYVSTVESGGFSICRAEDFGHVTEPVPVKIKQLWASDGKIMFTADLTGVNELYALDPSDGRTSRLTSSRFGASEFCAAGDSLYFCLPSAGGRLPYSMHRDSVEYRPADFSELPEYPLAGRRETPGESSAGATRMSEPRRYRGSLVPKLHSWLPAYLDFDSVDNLSLYGITSSLSPGASIFFQNILGNLYGNAGVRPSSDFSGRWRAEYAFNLTTDAFYPVFEAKFSGNARDAYSYSLTRDADGRQTLVTAFSDRPAFNLTLRAYVPLNLSRGGLSIGLIPTLTGSITNDRLFTSRQVSGDGAGGSPSAGVTTSEAGMLNRLTAGVRGYVMESIPSSRVYPRLGIGAEIGGSMSPGTGGLIRPNVYAMLYGYLPGATQTQGLRLSALADHMTGDGPLIMDNIASTPRGFSAATRSLVTSSFRTKLKLSADYAVPFGAVDWSFLSPVAYIRNFELTPHADLSLLSGGRTGSGKLYSIGADLCVRLGNLLWIPFDTRIGISYNYNGGSFMDALLDADYERSPHSIGFVFSIDL